MQSGAPTPALKSEFNAAQVLAPKTPACPSRDFPTFLKLFASDANVRREFTAPEVSVADYVEQGDEETQTIKILKVARDQYKEFTLRYSNGGFHHADADGNVDSGPLGLHMDKKKNGYLVGYQYGMSEGNSWLFQFANQCWYLTEDPEPPTE